MGNSRQRNSLLEGCQVSGETHVGLIRASNEDSYIYVDYPWRNAVLVGVADGMGGHEFGEVASFLVMKYLLQEWKQRGNGWVKSKSAVIEFIEEALSTANQHIYHVNRELKIRWCMGTTVTLGVFFQNKVIIAQVGDSRCYRVRRRGLKQLTVDQSWQEEMVASGIMSRAEAACHPLSNMLTNCAGAIRTLKVEYTEETVSPGDRFVFCTDGLNSMVGDGQIFKLIRETEHPEEGTDTLIKQALRAGGTDNVTIVCLYT